MMDHGESMNAAQKLITGLQEAQLTLGSAESLTGGLMAARLISVPGASAVYIGGVIAYHADIKRRLLEVLPEEIDRGVVSEAVAVQMALGAKKLLKVDLAVACTGVAGPGGNQGVEPGTIWISGASETQNVAQLLQLRGTRDDIRNTTVDHMIDLVWNLLLAQ